MGVNPHNSFFSRLQRKPGASFLILSFFGTEVAHREK